MEDLLTQRAQFLNFLARRVPSREIAEDILQSAYVRALESPNKPAESSTAWFYRILRNAVIDRYRHRAAEDRALTAWAAELETEVPANDLTHDLVCQCIARVLPSMKPAYAEILTEVDLNESTLSVFAKAHAITPANATVRMHRARKALKQRLLETCGACSAHGCLDCDCCV